MRADLPHAAAVTPRRVDQWSAWGPVKDRLAFSGVVLMPRPAIARREEGAYGQYSPDEERRQTGWIGGHKCEGLLDRAHGRHAHERRDPTLLQLPMDWSATMTSTGRTHATALRVTTLGASQK